MCRQAAGRRAWHLGVTCGGCGALRKEAEELTSGGGPPGGGRGLEREDVELEHHPGDVPLTQQLPRASQHLHLVPLHVSLQHPHGRVARHLVVESDDGHTRARPRFERLPAGSSLSWLPSAPSDSASSNTPFRSETAAHENLERLPDGSTRSITGLMLLQFDGFGS